MFFSLAYNPTVLTSEVDGPGDTGLIREEDGRVGYFINWCGVTLVRIRTKLKGTGHETSMCIYYYYGRSVSIPTPSRTSSVVRSLSDQRSRFWA